MTTKTPNWIKLQNKFRTALTRSGRKWEPSVSEFVGDAAQDDEW